MKLNSKEFITAVNLLITFTLFLMMSVSIPAQSKRVRDYGIKIGNYETGRLNSITDVDGVKAGHFTLIDGRDIRTGATAIIPHGGNIFMQKVPAAIYIANGFGKLAGYSQVEELGEIETPVILTNTLSVPTAADALIDYILSTGDNAQHVRSVNPVVGETNDGALNNIQARRLTKENMLEAVNNAAAGMIEEGAVGAGTGTVCFGYKGGIGTASRIVRQDGGEYTIGVLVQTNFGGDLTIAGIPVREKIKIYDENNGDGSCMIVIATDAPLTSRNLKRLAKRAVFGLAKTGGNCSNGSGEYVIAFSTAAGLRIPYSSPSDNLSKTAELRNDRMTPLFEAVIEAVEEAILNSLFTAQSMTGTNGRTIEKLPVDKVIQILKRHKIIE